MPTPTNTTPARSFVSLSNLAEDILGISRARLYELIQRGAMPAPVYDVRSRRPMYDAEAQRMALTVRQTGVGIDGSAVIWYRRERQVPSAAPTPTRTHGPRRRATASRVSTRYDDLVGKLQGLGVTNADEHAVASAVTECFPNGLENQQESDVLRILFRYLRRREGT